MWVVPLIHLFMPFWYFRDLLRACDPAELPPVDVETLPPRGYRRPGVETTDVWRRPWLPFRIWWALWVVSLATYPGCALCVGGDVRRPRRAHLPPLRGRARRDRRRLDDRLRDRHRRDDRDPRRAGAPARSDRPRPNGVSEALPVLALGETYAVFDKPSGLLVHRGLGRRRHHRGQARPARDRAGVSRASPRSRDQRRPRVRALVRGRAPSPRGVRARRRRQSLRRPRPRRASSDRARRPPAPST